MQQLWFLVFQYHSKEGFTGLRFNKTQITASTTLLLATDGRINLLDLQVPDFLQDKLFLALDLIVLVLNQPEPLRLIIHIQLGLFSM